MERKSEGERDEMKLEMLLLLRAKRQTDADGRSQLLWFQPARGETRELEAKRKMPMAA